MDRLCVAPPGFARNNVERLPVTATLQLNLYPQQPDMREQSQLSPSVRVARQLTHALLCSQRFPEGVPCIEKSRVCGCTDTGPGLALVRNKRFSAHYFVSLRENPYPHKLKPLPE